MLGLGNSLARGGAQTFINDYSLDFDNTDDYVDCGGGINLMSGGTMACWLKSNSTSETGKVLWNGIGSNTQHFSISLATGDVRVTVKDGGASAIGASGFAITTGWHFVVATYDGSSTVKLYADGNLQTGTNVSETTQSPGVVLGARFTGSGTTYDFFYNGKIDEVAIWDAVLSAGSVATLYNNGVPTDLLADSNSANLKGWWRMGDGNLDTFPLIADQVNPTLGSEEINDGDFTTTGTLAASTQGTVWKTEEFWTIASGKATVTNPSAAGYDCINSLSSSPDNTIVGGAVYKCQWEIESLSASEGTAAFRVNVGDTEGADHTTIGVKTEYIRAGASSSLAFRLRSGGVGFTGTVVVKNISCKKVNGNAGNMINMASDDIVTDTP